MLCCCEQRSEESQQKVSGNSEIASTIQVLPEQEKELESSMVVKGFMFALRLQKLVILCPPVRNLPVQLFLLLSYALKPVPGFDRKVPSPCRTQALQEHPPGIAAPAGSGNLGACLAPCIKAAQCQGHLLPPAQDRRKQPQGEGQVRHQEEFLHGRDGQALGAGEVPIPGEVQGKLSALGW